MPIANGEKKPFRLQKANGFADSESDVGRRRNLCHRWTTVRRFGYQRQQLATLAAVATLFSIGYLYCRSTSLDYRLLYGDALSSNGLAGKCRIPQLDPYDESISAYLSKAEPLNCRLLQPELTYVTDDGRLILNHTALEAERYSTEVSCEFRCFDRAEGEDDFNLAYGQWRPLKVNQSIDLRSKDGCEFTEITCSRAFLPIYKNTHVVIRPKSSAANVGGAAPPPPPPPPTPTPPASVLLFVLDSVSRSNFLRNLPLTWEVLKNKYGSTLYDGFTKVGDNSLPNALAFLTGKRASVAGYVNDMNVKDNGGYYDDWPLIWKEYADAGYLTFYAEDYPHYNLFQNLAKGFRRKPTDHYFRPFWLHVWGTFLHRRSTHLCYGNRPKHRFQLNYLEQFLRSYAADRPTFAFNWLTELGHDWLNQVGVGDQDLAAFFSRLRPLLNNTLLVVLSDHGHRFDSIRQTVVGRVEERMPFFTVALPAVWQTTNEVCSPTVSRLRRHLINNANRLTTPFDLHATLQHFLRLATTGSWCKPIAGGGAGVGVGGGGGGGGRTASPINTGRGRTLLQSIDPDRSCADADIPEEFCVCQQETQVENASTDPRVLRGARIAVEFLNQQLAPVADRCQPLRLVSVQNAQTFLPNPSTVLHSGLSFLYGGSSPSGFYVNYRVTLSVAPSGAVFEATLRYSLKSDSFQVIGDVNRINRYGQQSHCIDSALLKKFCYCNVQLSEPVTTVASASAIVVVDTSST